DLVACAAVAIEGLIPPIEKRHWDTVRHDLFIDSVKHNPDTTNVIRGVMWEMEITLASKAPHDVVFLDGSITNPFGNLNAALEKISNDDSKTFSGTKIKEALIGKFESFLDAYHTVLNSNRTDKLWIGCPKYTSLREIGKKLSWPEHYDDRALLTSVLNAGEFTIPVAYELAGYNWHINLTKEQKIHVAITQKLHEIVGAIKKLHIVYYKPHLYTPAIRIEVPSSVTTNDYQMKMLLQAIEFQTRTPGIMEPYPLYMADRIVKNLSNALPTFRQTVTNCMASSFVGDLSDIFFQMHSYRTDQGK
ncbi:MAG: DNA double-strand break repair nuclease NurA, partial [Polyangia bacterium]